MFKVFEQQKKAITKRIAEFFEKSKSGKIISDMQIQTKAKTNLNCFQISYKKLC